ncbi:hypothetical protein MmiHf6_17220 [Methanimicrococcus hongohii]|uniref:DUF4367 domain-containing protein n=1 Tax=Methanimicrococcus hongohii TaxID=3028295 RepID=A0AA96VAC2_9EURY|nr:hypothetical protein [Methanimicrococcus sp. Hf6]WNY24391.1 hypothetical protein MmiHf6_17220 [Methanimicrococcus sp. Hf6]
MKKILIVLLVALLAVAVGVSGCLGGDDDTPDNNTSNNSSNNSNNSSNNTNGTNNSSNNTNGTNNSTTDNSTNNSSTNATPEISFNNSTVTVSVSGYELLAIRTVTADEQNIDGVTDALNGLSGYYSVNSTNVYLSAYQTANNSSAEGYVQSMIDANKEKYPTTYNITNTTINGNDATVITTTSTSGGTTVERYVVTWASGDKLVVVDGPATLSEIKTIAEASDL